MNNNNIKINLRPSILSGVPIKYNYHLYVDTYNFNRTNNYVIDLGIFKLDNVDNNKISKCIKNNIILILIDLDIIEKNDSRINIKDINENLNTYKNNNNGTYRKVTIN